ETGKEMPRYSVYSEADDGLAETARLLAKLGWEPTVWTRPVQQLRPGPQPRLLIMVEPQLPSRMPGQESGLGQAEARSLMRWVEEGTPLLLGGRHMNGIHQELDILLTANLKAAREEGPRDVVLSDAGAYTAGIDQLQVEGRDEVASSKGLPLWWLN